MTDDRQPEVCAVHNREKLIPFLGELLCPGCWAGLVLACQEDPEATKRFLEVQA